MEKVLVIQTAFIGDAILGTALLEQIHADQEQIRRQLDATRIKVLSNRVKEFECQESAK